MLNTDIFFPVSKRALRIDASTTVHPWHHGTKANAKIPWLEKVKQLFADKSYEIDPSHFRVPLIPER